jgi:magnesium and cobalt transporter
MNDPSRPSLLERLSAFILREPGDREQLVQLLRSAYSRNLLDADAMSIIEGALTVSEMQVRDIMVPRAQVDFIDINEPVESFIPQVISTAHSRFPVIDQNRDDVIGILLAKDLLRYYAGEEDFNVREMLRPAVFVPEAKRLNVLLREFRASRNHMAIVIDEYGGVAGLVTIEDVLEQIVGDIEDEYDRSQPPRLTSPPSGVYTLPGMLHPDEVAERTGFEMPDGPYETLAGFLLTRFDRIPERGDHTEFAGWEFKVTEMDGRRIAEVLMVAPTRAQQRVEP